MSPPVASPASRYIHADGHALCVTVEGSGSPLLVLHGFTGSSATMRPVARALRDQHRTVCLDLLGHGCSDAPRDVAAYRMEPCVAGLLRVLDVLGIDRSHVLGYSMGGRIALALAALHPLRIASVVAVGASAGIAEPEGRSARRLADEALANAIETEGLTPFVERWMAQPLIATQRRRLGESFWAKARAQRLENRPHGLAGCLRGLGLGAQPALHERLASLETPMLLVAGAEDAKFHDIAADLCARLARGRLAVIPNAGHAAHLENCDAFLATTRAFLRECDAELAASAAAAAIPSTETPRRGDP